MKFIENGFIHGLLTMRFIKYPALVAVCVVLAATASISAMLSNTTTHASPKGFIEGEGGFEGEGLGSDPNAVLISYSFGFGRVIYSTIPADCYFPTQGCENSNPFATSLRNIYIPNLLAYAAEFANIGVKGFIEGEGALEGDPGTGVVIGYYNLSNGEGLGYMEPTLGANGDALVPITDPVAAQLAGIHILYVAAWGNDFLNEYQSAFSDISDFVSNGGVLVIDDGENDAPNLLPGGAGITYGSYHSIDVNVADSSTTLTNGPGGVIDDNTLDNGDSSIHGAMLPESLPGGTQVILVTGAGAGGFEGEGFNEGEVPTEGEGDGCGLECHFDIGETVAGGYESPVISVPPANGGTLYLSFDYWLETENSSGGSKRGKGGAYDTAGVIVSVNGEEWFLASNVFLADYQLCDGAGVWLTALFPIDYLAGEDIQLRFIFDSMDSIANCYGGFYVDNVHVFEYAGTLFEGEGAPLKGSDTKSPCNTLTDYTQDPDVTTFSLFTFEGDEDGFSIVEYSSGGGGEGEGIPVKGVIISNPVNLWSRMDQCAALSIEHPSEFVLGFSISNTTTEGEGALEGEGSTEGEGALEGEGSTEGEGALEGEGLTEGEGALEGEGSVEGEVNTPPAITLNGFATMNVNCGSTFTDPGATAFDEEDGDITGSVIVGGDSVNTALPGTYIITYNVQDSGGLSATQVTRTVNVVDNTPPVIILLGDNPQILMQGDPYVELGATATDACSGNLTANIVEDASGVDTNIPGDYSVTYNVADNAGNPAVEAVRTVSVLPFVVEEGEGATEGEGETNTPPVITLNGAATLAVECGSAFIDPGAIALDEEDGDITGSVTVGGNTVNPALPGTYVITYNVQDSGGLSATQVTRTVNVVDNTPPVISLLGANPQNLTQGEAYVELGAIASDACDGNLTSGVAINASAVDTNTPGIYQVTYNVSDNAGNAAIPVARVVVVQAGVEGEMPFDDCVDICPGTENAPDADGDGLSDACEQCLGTNPNNPDSDGDGMSDYFEWEHKLHPLNPNDAGLDPDGDFLTNLEEFLLQSNPRDSTSPYIVRFVAPNGVDQQGGGSNNAPWGSLSYAQTQLVPTETQPVLIRMAPGVYRENVILKRHTVLMGPVCDFNGPLENHAVIQGSIYGNEGAVLRNLVIIPERDDAILLEINNYRMRVECVQFRGNSTRQATGIRVLGLNVVDTVISRSLFDSLAIGLEVRDAFPKVHRNDFQNTSIAHLVVRESPFKEYLAKVPQGAAGDANDSERGWNRFLGTVDEKAVINERTNELLIENNEWDTNDPEEIKERIEGPADFEPFKVVGSAVLAGSIACTVRDAETLQPVTDATVSISPSAFRPITENTKGVYVFSAVMEGTYTVTATSPTLGSATATATFSGGQLVSVMINLGGVKSGTGCFGGSNSNSKSAGPAERPADLALMLAVIAAFAVGAAFRHRRNTAWLR